MQFGFDEDVRISVEGSFDYFDSTTELSWKPEPAHSQIASRAVALLGAAIREFEAYEVELQSSHFPTDIAYHSRFQQGIRVLGHHPSRMQLLRLKQEEAEV